MPWAHSALAKRYVEEAGSERLESLLDGAERFELSAIAQPEVISGLCRRRRERSLSAVQKVGLAFERLG